MNISNRLATLIRERKPAVGMWINFSDPGLAQIAAVSGYDWILIDTEHNPLTEDQVQGLILAVSGTDVQTIVRVRANREEHIKWLLDCGAGGVVIPSIKDAEDARRAVEFTKYAPLGRRGYGPNRASGFFTRDKDYVSRANDDILLICQIELASAVEEVDEICQIPGVDAVWIGPTDLAQSMGHLGNPKHPDVQAAIRKIIDTANKHDKPWGRPSGIIEDYRKCVELGGVVMILGSDSRLLRIRATELVKEAKGTDGK